MKATLINYQDNWQAVKDAAMNTIGKEGGKYPSSGWKRKILLAEHSPIRLLRFTIRLEDVPYWVSVHITRHKFGIEHFVSTQRTDRTGIDRNEMPQNERVTHVISANAQALINISRKRLCMQASPETRKLWTMVVDEVRKYEPELASVMVRECIYRKMCPEMHSCGYCSGSAYKEEVKAYGRGSLEGYPGL